MILKRKEKDNLIKAIYDSSNILASTYNTETKDLILIFNKGGQYKYPNVSNTDYTRFELADSQGKVFKSHIKQYTFEKLENINPDVIIKEIENIKTDEKKNLIKNKQGKLLTKMKELVDHSYDITINDQAIIINESQVKQLQTLLDEFLTIITNESQVLTQ